MAEFSSPVPAVEPSPCFVLDEQALERNLTLLSQVCSSAGVSLLMALKAFALPSIFPRIATAAQGAAVSSLNELVLARDCFAGNLHAYAPVYRDDEWPVFAAACHRVTFNSLNQFHHFYPKHGDISCGLRINPHFSPVSNALYNPCAPGSRLGLTAAELDSGLPPGVEGLHCHNLCESDAESTAITLQAIEEHFGRFLPDIHWLNLGGGHLLTRAGYDTDRFIRSMQEFRNRHPHIELIIEPGAAFVWDTGTLVATVLDIVINDGIRTAILDTSFATHMPDCLEMPYRPQVEGELSEPSEWGYRLGGCSCLAGDWVGDYYFPSELKIGQRIQFCDMMHYTMVKTNTFNGINLPAIAIRHRDGTLEVLRTFGPESVQSRLP